MTCYTNCLHCYVCKCADSVEYKDGEDMKADCPHFIDKADFVEVKHSRWENISGFDVCNVCGTSPAYCEPKPNNPKGYPPYCHHCGAKMDGERRDT